jgi:hypothetical protein
VGSRLSHVSPRGARVRAGGPGTLEPATRAGRLDTRVTPDRYVFVRAGVGDAVVAYSSPLWAG